MIELSRRTILKKDQLELVESTTRIGKTFFVYKYDDNNKLEGLEAFSNYEEANECFYSLIKMFQYLGDKK